MYFLHPTFRTRTAVENPASMTALCSLVLISTFSVLISFVLSVHRFCTLLQRTGCLRLCSSSLSLCWSPTSSLCTQVRNQVWVEPYFRDPVVFVCAHLFQRLPTQVESAVNKPEWLKKFKIWKH